MKLVETLPWRDEIVDAPPVRLEYKDVLVPEGIKLTFIGSRHDGDGGLPDYLEEALSGVDVFLPEQADWDSEYAKRIQRVADGDFKARQKSLEINAMSKHRNPGPAEWQEVMWKALYGSRVRVAMVDYPRHHPGIKAMEKLLANDMQMNDETMRQLAARDRFILNRTVTELARLQQQDRRLVGKDELRVLAVFGAGHFAIHDAVAQAAKQNTLFSSQLLFEESAAFTSSSKGTENELRTARVSNIKYQNWLRAPETN